MSPLQLNNLFFNNVVNTKLATSDSLSPIKFNTLSSNSSGDQNSGLGYSVLSSNTIGGNNTAIGVSSLSQNSSGSGNSAFGVFSLQYNLCSFNIAIGGNSGKYFGTTFSIFDTSFLTAATYSIFIGYDSRPLYNNSFNEIVIGATAIGNGSNSVTLGNDSITKTYLKGTINGNSFVKNGGSSSQYLMADGSVSLGPSFSGLPLSGGALTGPLSGTRASFSQSSSLDTLSAYNGTTNATAISGGAANGISGYFNNNSTTNPVLKLLGLSSTTLIDGRNTSDVTTFSVTSAGKVTGSSFVKSGGTSSEYLMADGSVTTAYKYNFGGSLTHTGTLTTTSLLTITIPANSLSDYLNLRSIMVQQSGPALAGFQIRVWHNSANDFNTATRIANFAFGAGGADLFAQMTRRFSIQSGTLFGFPSTPSSATGEGSNPNAALSIAFNTAIINYLFVSVQLNDITDTATLRNVNITN